MDAFFESSFWNIPAPFNMVVVIIGLICLTSVLEKIIKSVRIGIDSEMNRRMKREMIESGLTIEEAERWAKLEMSQRPPKDG